MFTDYHLIAQVIRENNIKRVVVTKKQFIEGVKPIGVKRTVDEKNDIVIFEFFELESEGE